MCLFVRLANLLPSTELRNPQLLAFVINPVNLGESLSPGTTPMCKHVHPRRRPRPGAGAHRRWRNCQSVVAAVQFETTTRRVWVEVT